jgi:hypothetical protein
MKRVQNECGSSFQPTCPSSGWYMSRPVSCKYCTVASTTVKSGLQFSFSPSSSFPELASLRFPHPPSKYETSPHRSPAIACSVFRCTVHNGHTQRTWRTVSSSIPQGHFASSTIPIRDRYWLRRQCPVRAWMRIEACLEEKAPYRRNVCRPGSA